MIVNDTLERRRTEFQNRLSWLTAPGDDRPPVWMRVTRFLFLQKLRNKGRLDELQLEQIDWDQVVADTLENLLSFNAPEELDALLGPRGDDLAAEMRDWSGA